MSTFQTRYKNKKFVKERVELDGHSYQHCDFEGCLIILEKGQTEIKNCSFKGCRLLLLGQALSIAKILQIFIGEKPLRVLDFAEPGIFGEKRIQPQRTQRSQRNKNNK